MRRTAIAGTTLGLLLGSGLMGGAAAPASAEGFQPGVQPFGSTESPDRVLKQGCHKYKFFYRVTVPSSEWSAEFFLVGPTGVGLASSSIDSAVQKKVGNRKFTLCRPSLTYGKHKIKMKVTYQTGPTLDDQTAGFVKTSKFRFTRPKPKRGR